MVFGSGSSRPGKLTGGHLCSGRLLSVKREGGKVAGTLFDQVTEWRGEMGDI
jgi:hypothetical protein